MSKIRLQTISGLLCIAAFPVLYIGGINGNTGVQIAGVLIFAIGMAIPPLLKIAGK